MEKVTIKSENEAVALLKRLVEGYELTDAEDIEFESWPKFIVRIKGSDFNGTIPTRIMPILLDLQKEVHKVYCLTTYGDENIRRLTKKDREQLELVVKVDEGSSIFETLLQAPILKILQDAASRMSPEQLTAIIIVFGLSVTSTIFWKLWINKRIKEKELDQTIDLSRLEKEKMEIVQKAVQKFPAIDTVSESFGDVRNELLTRLKASDNLQITPDSSDAESVHPVTITGVQAKQFTHTPREKAVEKMISDEFFLKSVEFTRPDGVRIEVERISDNYSFKADVPLGVLGYDQSEALKNNSWNKTNVEMSMLVKELHGRYTSAKVVSVKQLNDT